MTSLLPDLTCNQKFAENHQHYLINHLEDPEEGHAWALNNDLHNDDYIDKWNDPEVDDQHHWEHEQGLVKHQHPDLKEEEKHTRSNPSYASTSLCILPRIDSKPLNKSSGTKPSYNLKDSSEDFAFPFVYSEVLSKYEIMNENGHARNLSKLQLEGSIYDDLDPAAMEYARYNL